MGAQAPKATKEEGRGRRRFETEKGRGAPKSHYGRRKRRSERPPKPFFEEGGREGALSLHPCTPSLPLSTPHHTRSEGTNGRTEEEEEEKEEGGSGGGGGGGGRQAAFFLPFPERSLSLFL